MEGVGAEVSQKIRSAIKAKLMELGAYVDDELPDYIMVLVANKRSKQQMENELELFLTDNTSAFTAWLHQVLSKLQEVTVSLDKKSSDSDKKKKVIGLDDHRQEKEKKKKIKKDEENDKSQLTSNTDDPGQSQESSKMDLSSDININGLNSSKSQPDSAIVASSSNSARECTTSVSKQSCQVDEDDEDFIHLKADAEADLWEGEADDISLSSDVKDKESLRSASRKASESSKMDATDDHTKSAERPKGVKPGSSEWERSPTSPATATPAPAAPPPPRPQPTTTTTSRIIKISEVLREEEETLNSSLKRNLDDKRLARKPESNESNKKLKPSPVPITFEKEGAKEDDEAVFGKHIARELRHLTPSQRSLAKLKIQQVLFECQQPQPPPQPAPQPALKSTISSAPSSQRERQRRRDRGRNRSDQRQRRLRKQSPIRPADKQRRPLNRKPLNRKRSPIRLGTMRMDSPKYNQPKRLSQ